MDRRYGYGTEYGRLFMGFGAGINGYLLSIRGLIQPTGCRCRGYQRMSKKIDKSALTISEPKRIRSRKHLRWIASQPCLICGLMPCQAHHVKHLQLRARGLKSSDEFAVPLCVGHHASVEAAGREPDWWMGHGIAIYSVTRALCACSPALGDHNG